MASLSRVTEGGDRLEQLKQLSRILADSIDMCDSMRDMAALSRQYRETIREIDMLENGEDANDEIASIILRHREPAADD